MNRTTDTVYRYLGGMEQDGILSCGYMEKSAAKSQLNFTIPYYSCFLLLRGSGRYWDDRGNNIRLKPGCVVQRLPDRLHSTSVDPESGWLEFYVSFGRSTYLSMKSIGAFPREVPVQQLDAVPENWSGFDQLLAALKQAADIQLLPLLFRVQQLVWEWACETQPHPEPSGDWLAHACQVLEEAPEEAGAVRRAAAEVAMGYESFRKQFALKMGLSPNGYRMERRMLTARLMLLGGQPVKTVARSLGYSDSYTFSKQFKRRIGVSPVGYARSCKKQSPDGE